VIGVDYGLVIPDESKTLRQGAMRPWLSESYRGWNDDLVQYARKRGVAVDTPWRDLPEARGGGSSKAIPAG
jgi:excinuclease ABC subunit A